jgi:hypothetical protein
MIGIVKADPSQLRLAIYEFARASWADEIERKQLSAALEVTPPTQTSQQASLVADVNTAGISATSLPFPLPSDYGVYPLVNAELTELQFLSEQVPDKRVAISTPINQPSHTTLPDGNRNSWCSAAISRATRLIELKFVYLTPAAYVANLTATCDRLRNPDPLRRSHVALPEPDGVKPPETLIAAGESSAAGQPGWRAPDIR